ncbi:MAG: hypothetical protein MUC87_05105 [Bacteroidia bacterium]|jgi:hypothetical protein|nr:hypothetical protein [Bacteroidia bacterium]
MNPQTEQLKRRLHHKINSIEDIDYLTTLDAVITWETTREKAQNPRFSLWKWLSESMAGRKKSRSNLYPQTAFR